MGLVSENISKTRSIQFFRLSVLTENRREAALGTLACAKLRPPNEELKDLGQEGLCDTPSLSLRSNPPPTAWSVRTTRMDLKRANVSGNLYLFRVAVKRAMSSEFCVFVSDSEFQILLMRSSSELPTHKSFRRGLGELFPKSRLLRCH